MSITRVLLTLALLLTLTSPGLAGSVRCTTYEERTMGRLQTICSDGTRAVSRWNSVLDRWDTTITESPRKACTGQMDPISKQVRLHCR